MINIDGLPVGGRVYTNTGLDFWYLGDGYVLSNNCIFTIDPNNWEEPIFELSWLDTDCKVFPPKKFYQADYEKLIERRGYMLCYQRAIRLLQAPKHKNLSDAAGYTCLDEPTYLLLYHNRERHKNDPDPIAGCAKELQQTKDVYFFRCQKKLEQKIQYKKYVYVRDGEMCWHQPFYNAITNELTGDCYTDVIED
jgi:hypothetical protein